MSSPNKTQTLQLHALFWRLNQYNGISANLQLSRENKCFLKLVNLKWFEINNFRPF